MTPAGGPDALRMDWNDWTYIYMFPLPTPSVMTEVCSRLGDLRGRVLFIAPLWTAHQWCMTMLRWCQDPLPLNHLALEGYGIRHSGLSSAFHTWSFVQVPEYTLLTDCVS